MDSANLRNASSLTCAARLPSAPPSTLPATGSECVQDDLGLSGRQSRMRGQRSPTNWRSTRIQIGGNATCCSSIPHGRKMMRCRPPSRVPATMKSPNPRSRDPPGKSCRPNPCLQGPSARLQCGTRPRRPEWANRGKRTLGATCPRQRADGGTAGARPEASCAQPTPCGKRRVRRSTYGPSGSLRAAAGPPPRSPATKQGGPATSAPSHACECARAHPLLRRSRLKENGGRPQFRLRRASTASPGPRPRIA